MQTPTAASRDDRCAGISPQKARWLLRGLQGLFLLIAAWQLNAPLLSAHNERQNQTYDVARQIFHQGWSAVATPKASFSLPGYERKPFTVIRQEFPFHGLFSWPLVKLFGHELAVLRLISVGFALASIEFLFLILWQWLGPELAVAGAALWALSPLLLQFGQVPMPDILCTTGMLAAFWFALKRKLPASSGCFLFAILAKISVISFGLPILTALLLARNCQSLGTGLRVAIFWGAAPLAGLVAWTLLELRDPDTPWTILKIAGERSSVNNLLTLKFYLFFFACLLPYGLGGIGTLGCLFATTAPQLSKIPPALKWTLGGAIIFYVLVVVAKIPEPQYLLPLLAWLVMLATFGCARFANGFRRRLTVFALVSLQILTGVIFSLDLKSAHLPDFASLQNAARLIPAHSRVIVAYPFYGASPAVWLNQNVLAIQEENQLEARLPQLQLIGFDFILILDVKSHTESFWHGSLAKMGFALFPKSAATNTAGARAATDFANPASAFRKFCDGRFPAIFSSPHVVLYSLTPTNRPPD